MTASSLNAARSDFFLCLARAFAVPSGAQALDLLREALPEDLESLARDRGYPLAEALADYRTAMAAIPDNLSLLACYSRLFLVPGEAHPSLNTGFYLDGTLAGSSVAAMADSYRRGGLEPASDLRDLPDHLAVQLEFVARCFAAAAQTGIPAGPQNESGSPPAETLAVDFLATFVARWIGPWRADLEAAHTRFKIAANPYRALGRILDRAVQTELAARPAVRPTQPGVDPEIARQRRELAGQPLTERDLEIIRERLRADGLASEHVAIPLEARDRTMGLAAMTPPAPPSHRRDHQASGSTGHVRP